MVVLAVLLGSALTGWSAFAYVGALAWLSHIVVGWATGDGGKAREHATVESLDSPATRHFFTTDTTSPSV